MSAGGQFAGLVAEDCAFDEGADDFEGRLVGVGFLASELGDVDADGDGEAGGVHGGQALQQVGWWCVHCRATSSSDDRRQ